LVSFHNGNTFDVVCVMLAPFLLRCRYSLLKGNVWTWNLEIKLVRMVFEGENCLKGFLENGDTVDTGMSLEIFLKQKTMKGRFSSLPKEFHSSSQHPCF
jgi:hypothetical protein